MASLKTPFSQSMARCLVISRVTFWAMKIVAMNVHAMNVSSKGDGRHRFCPTTEVKRLHYVVVTSAANLWDRRRRFRDETVYVDGRIR